MTSNCCICSNSFFQAVFKAALNLDDDFINETLKARRNYRLNFVSEKIKNFQFNFTFEEFEIELYKDGLEALEINELKPFEDCVSNLINLKDYRLLNYYLKQELKMDIFSVDFAKREALKERERRTQKFIKKNFLKKINNINFVKKKKGCDCLLFFNPSYTQQHHLYINDVNDEKQKKIFRRMALRFVFSKM